MTVEQEDDGDDDTNEEQTSDEEAIGLATYSNSEATIFSYVSIFENLWIQTQMDKKQEQDAAAG